MRKDWKHLEDYRIRRNGNYSSDTGDTFGTFAILLEAGVTLLAIATDGDPSVLVMGEWEHVSAQARQPSISGEVIKRCPTWDEMCALKDLFWNDDECVAQFHPPKSDYVNAHPYVLHLWKHRTANFLRPPKACV